MVTVAGAMMMTLYKGHLMQMAWSSHVQPHSQGAETPVAAVDPDPLAPSVALHAWAISPVSYAN
jgi:hypothetical protein